ncbi:hypothetical protein LCGC14_3114250, partial [marine sediment metagenome]
MGSGRIKVGGKTFTAAQWSKKQHPVTKVAGAVTKTQTRTRTLAPKRMLPVRKSVPGRKAVPVLPIAAKPVMKQSTTSTTIRRIRDIGT